MFKYSDPGKLKLLNVVNDGAISNTTLHLLSKRMFMSFASVLPLLYCELITFADIFL